MQIEGEIKRRYPGRRLVLLTQKFGGVKPDGEMRMVNVNAHLSDGTVIGAAELDEIFEHLSIDAAHPMNGYVD